MTDQGTGARPPHKGSGSGEHTAVRAYRAKLDSIGEIAAPGGRLDALGKRIDDKLRKLKSDRPARDPRREDASDEPIPVDVIVIPDDTPTLRALTAEAAAIEDDPFDTLDEPTLVEKDPFPSPQPPPLRKT